MEPRTRSDRKVVGNQYGIRSESSPREFHRNAGRVGTGKAVFDLDAYVAGNFSESEGILARRAAFHALMRHHKREIPDIAEVRQRMEELASKGISVED